jgi:hypothetical protein
MMDDVDRAAVASGQATRIARPERPSLIYEQRCDFCKQVHRSEFFDEVEETILRCRDAAPGSEKGLLVDFSGDTHPIRVEGQLQLLQGVAGHVVRRIPAR